MTSTMRRAVAMLGLTGALAVVGLTAAPGPREPLNRTTRSAGLDLRLAPVCGACDVD